MTRVFADSFYFLAILNPKDDAHQKALEFATRHEEPIVTTGYNRCSSCATRSARRSQFAQWVACRASQGGKIRLPVCPNKIN